MQKKLMQEKSAVIQKGKLGLKWEKAVGSERKPPNKMARMKLIPPTALTRLKLRVRLVLFGLRSASAARQRVRLPANSPVKQRLMNRPVRECRCRESAVNAYPRVVPRTVTQKAFLRPKRSENCPMRGAPKN